MRLCRNSMCFPFEAFLRVLWAWTFSVVWGSPSSRKFSSPLPFLFPLLIQCNGGLFPFPAWGLKAWLPGFSSHGSSLHLGAGCQWWKLLDVSGTQPPFSDAVVKLIFVSAWAKKHNLYVQCRCTFRLGVEKYKYSPIRYMVTIFNPQCKDRLGWEINLDQGDEWQAEWK